MMQGTELEPGDGITLTVFEDVFTNLNSQIDLNDPEKKEDIVE